jgi:hypothetical protein
MGVLAPVSAHMQQSAWPPMAHVSSKSPSNPSEVIYKVLEPWELGQLLKITLFVYSIATFLREWNPNIL